MEIVALSLNHQVTPLAVREAIVFGQSEAEGFLRRVQERLDASEAMLISTCNRTEIYAVHIPETGQHHDRGLLELLAEERGFEPTENPRNYAVLRREEAARHLLRVAGGLESQILGETQILGQVKTALAWGQEAGTSGRILHRLWERAIRLGKRVRSETAIGEGALSASYAALELARKIFGELRDKRVLLIGTGEIGVLALENLAGIPLADLTIMNRTRERAVELAERFGGRVRGLEEIVDALRLADLVISSTSAPEPLVRYDEMRRIRQQRGGSRPLLIVDLALPRDFEESCGSLDEVFLKNLDDLSDIVRSNLEHRRLELPRAHALVEQELASFLRWLHSLKIEPTIRRLRELFHSIREEELAEWRRSLSEETFEQVDRLTERLVNRLLHLPSKNLRRHAGVHDQTFAAIIRELLTEDLPHEPDEIAPSDDALEESGPTGGTTAERSGSARSGGE